MLQLPSQRLQLPSQRPCWYGATAENAPLSHKSGGALEVDAQAAGGHVMVEDACECGAHFAAIALAEQVDRRRVELEVVLQHMGMLHLCPSRMQKLCKALRRNVPLFKLQQQLVQLREAPLSTPETTSSGPPQSGRCPLLRHTFVFEHSVAYVQFDSHIQPYVLGKLQ